ncbi:hypothetical protein SLE2022_285640 [Rubroshorea leprosula]
MVDGEIARLESQIRQLQETVKHEQDAKSKQQQPAIPSNPIPGLPPPTPLQNPMNKPGGQEKMAFETMALHFINKGIKGDYAPSDLRSTVNEKENYQFQEETKFQERVPRKSRLLKPQSPLRDLRLPSPKIVYAPC